jgi:hypothetical protein
MFTGGAHAMLQDGVAFRDVAVRCLMVCLPQPTTEQTLDE